MNSKIEAKEAPLSKIFSDEFVFTIPIYQRPFSWAEANFEAMFDDIKDAMENDIDQYFIGSILLQQNNGTSFDVVDGQQRLTAITILLAVIRDLTSDDLAKAINSWIYQAGDQWKGLPAVMRVTPWEELKEFFDQYLYKDKGTTNFLKEFLQGKVKYKDQEDPKYHFFEAVFTFATKMGKGVNLNSYIKYLLRNVYCVYIITNTQTSAFRLFNVLNSRGLPLGPSDLLKSENLGAIEESATRDKYAQKWRNLEDELGREELGNVIAFIRTMQLKERARLGMHDEYKQIFDSKKLLVRGSTFIDYLLAVSEIYRTRILDPDLDVNSSEERNNYRVTVDLMARFVPFLDWIPPMLAFDYKYRSDKDLLKFLLLLERKVILEWLMGYSPTERDVSSGSILKSIESSKEPGAAMAKVNMPERPRALKALVEKVSDQEFYWTYGKRLAKYLLLRLDKEFWELENFPGYPGTITVEHVLPQTPADRSSWMNIFSKQERDDLTDSVGNLVLLSGRKNSEAQNYEFRKKKKVYFEKKGTAFKITQQLAKYDEWTPKELKARQEDLIERCKRAYLLK